jgi:hypothetical protein
MMRSFIFTVVMLAAAPAFAASLPLPEHDGMTRSHRIHRHHQRWAYNDCRPFGPFGWHGDVYIPFRGFYGAIGTLCNKRIPY